MANKVTNDEWVDVSDNNSEWVDIDSSQQPTVASQPTMLKSGITYNYYNPQEVQKKAWWHPALDVLPVGGAILGGIAGIPTGGLASAGLAGVGAIGGEAWKQVIEELTGQRKKADPTAMAIQGALGAGGEGVGQLGGKIFERFQPHIAEAMAGVPIEDYMRVLENLKSGKKIFPKGGFDEAVENVNRVASEATPENAVPIQNIYQGIEDVLGYFKGKNINPTQEALTPELENIAKQIEASKIANPNVNPEDISLYQSLTNDYGEDMAQKMMSNMGKELPEGSSDLANFYDIHRLKQSLGDAIKDFDKYKGQKMQALKGIYGSLNKNLNEANPLYNEANEIMRDRLAEQSFKGVIPRYTAMFAGKNVSKAGIGLGAQALGGAGTAIGLHAHPWLILPEMGLVAQMSPVAQGNILKLYSALMKAKLGGGMGSALNVLTPEAVEYKNAKLEGK